MKCPDCGASRIVQWAMDQVRRQYCLHCPWVGPKDTRRMTFTDHGAELFQSTSSQNEQDD